MDENIFLFFTNIFVFVLCVGLFMIIPQLTRKSYLFGVKIPPEEASCPEAAAMKKRYMISCFIGVTILLAVCALQFLFFRDKTLIATLYLPLLIIPVYLLAFIPNWKKAVRLKEEKKWAVSNVLFAETCSSHTRGDLSALPYGWYAGGILIILAAVTASVMRYPVLGDTIPVHFNYNMEPDRWADKSWLTVMSMPLSGLGLLLLMFLAAVSIEKVKLQIDPNNPRLSFAQHQVYRRRMGHAVGFVTLIIIVIIAMTQFLSLFPDAAIWSLAGGMFPIWCIMALSFLSFIPIIIVIIKTGQGGCKVKINLDNIDDTNESISAKSKTGGRGDDKYWLLGMFYYNPDDPAIVVEARFGAKINFNYAHIGVKIGVILFLLALAALYVWMTVTIL
ncbi:MAG: DUF1648 domain-containing protein [Treponema sp.]|nr:DUF1648 domain-containing protein [Treponema sp.]